MNTYLVAGMKFAAVLLLAGGILWGVAEHSGQHSGQSSLEQGIAYVHVAASDVDVIVDGLEYHVTSAWDGPIVCELRPGKHMLRMSRDGEVLYVEEFSVAVGKDVVLTAWERLPKDAVAAESPEQLSPASEPQQPDSAHK
jgi:hypothetical protein